MNGTSRARSARVPGGLDIDQPGSCGILFARPMRLKDRAMDDESRAVAIPKLFHLGSIG